jgi:hypothetical protein
MYLHVRTPAKAPPVIIHAPIRSGLLQRCTATAECEECRKNRRSGVHRSAAGTQPMDGVPETVYETLRSPGQPLDLETRAFMGRRFGHDFSQVRVHTDAKAAESAQAVNALAYTVGRDIVFASGQYAPRTSKQQELLAHELTHTIQQQFMPATNKSDLSIGAVKDDFEHGAEEKARTVLAGGISLPNKYSSIPKTAPVIQRQASPDWSYASTAFSPNEEPRLLAKFDMDKQRKRAWNLKQLTKDISEAFSASERAYVQILGVYPPNSKDRNAREDARANAVHRADTVQQALYQWINPKKFPLSRYSIGAKEGNVGDPDIEIWLTYGPLVVAPKLAPYHPLATPQAAPQKETPPASQKYSRPYPGTGFDAFKAFLSTEQGEELKMKIKKQLKSVWERTPELELILVLESMLVPPGIIVSGFFKALRREQRREIINIIFKDEDTSLLRPLPEKGTNLLELDLDPDFRPRKLRPPLGEFELP